MGNIAITADLYEAGQSGRFPVKVIAPGWGTSGYYQESVLAESAPLFEGAQMYWNHPKASDNFERPERDLRDLAGVLTNVRYEESHAHGAGIYGDATVFEPYRSTLNEIAPHIGVSIRAGGNVHEGEADGRSGMLVDEINSVQSVDFVTRAGAGGKVLAQFAEAARPFNEERDDMDEEQEEKTEMTIEDVQSAVEDLQEQFKDLQDQVKALQDQLNGEEEEREEVEEEAARAQEALAVANCKNLIMAEAQACSLPEATQSRLTESAGKYVHMKSGALDEAATKDAIQEAIKAEAEYISKLSGGIVKGMGSAPSEEADVDLTDAFRAMGLSESAAKLAANGR